LTTDKTDRGGFEVYQRFTRSLDNEILNMDISRCVRGGLFLSVAGVLLLQNSSGKSAQDERGRPQGTLKYHIQTALKEGRREITYVELCDMPSRINSIADILREYSLLRVKVIDKETTISDDIRRWVKLETLEVVRQQNKVDDQPLVEGAPPRFLPLQPSECILIEPGAVATIDGIHVERVGRSDYTLIRGREYLIAAYLESGGKRITPVANHVVDGIFAVTGSTLYPLAPNDRALVREVERVYGNDLERLRLGVRQYQESQKK